MKLIELSKQLEEIISKHDLKAIEKGLKSEELEKNILAINEKDRVLKIGIVGRVKAGKSSLLNALVFDGKNILPKAATPMTASLTKLEYGEKVEAFVEFYTNEDIYILKSDYEKYAKKFKELEKNKIEELIKIQQRKLNQEILDSSTKKEIEEKANKFTNLEMKNDLLYVSYDQYERIDKSKIDLIELQEFKNIEASNMDILNEKLLDFVGVDGKYMPFTKSVTIKLNNENLKDIEIIDTPGINDPISSREARTEDLLQECDVIFIVSPSGQFLSNEDIVLLDRITNKEGIQEIYIIASQIDNQLYGSEKDKNGGVLPKVLESISETLTKHTQEILNQNKEHLSPDIFKKFFKNDVLYSSGAIYSMLQSFENKQDWDANLQKIWENLNLHYPDYFNDNESAKINLSLLGNIPTIKNILEEVRAEKDEIIERRKNDFIKAKMESLKEYKEEITKDIEQNIEKIESSDDIEEIKKQKNNLLKIKIETSEAVTWKYKDCIDKFRINLKENLNKEINNLFESTQETIYNFENNEKESYTYDHGFLSTKFGSDRYETRYNEVLKVKAIAVRGCLKKLIERIEDLISKEELDKHIIDLKKILLKEIIPVIINKAGVLNIDEHQIERAVRNTIDLIEYQKIDYTSTFPKEIEKGGNLKGTEAEEFMECAYNYLSNFKTKVRKAVEIYISSMIDLLKREKLGENVILNYLRNIERLENDINNKELSLTKYKYILEQLGDIKC
ncbi:protein adenylyltransferase SelO family protein [Aliarcobacter sp. ERUVET-7]|uniref:protein adenylyltransferase SelO family protein n=1 Tax=Aliarcobacter sp. ERUVET-7 TaxID=3429683 RepID=UPI003D6C01E4